MSSNSAIHRACPNLVNIRAFIAYKATPSEDSPNTFSALNEKANYILNTGQENVHLSIIYLFGHKIQVFHNPVVTNFNTTTKNYSLIYLHDVRSVHCRGTIRPFCYLSSLSSTSLHSPHKVLHHCHAIMYCYRQSVTRSVFSAASLGFGGTQNNVISRNLNNYGNV